MGYIDKTLKIKSAKGIEKYIEKITAIEVMCIKMPDVVRVLWAVNNKLHHYDINGSVIYVIKEEDLQKAIDAVLDSVAPPKKEVADFGFMSEFIEKMNYKKDGIELEDGTFLPLSEMIEKCNAIKLIEDKLVLLEMGWEGRSGSIFEQIVLPSENVLRLKELLLDKEIYFGEIWGKHSEVYGTINENTFKIITDEDKIKSFLSSFPSGHDYDHSFIYTFIEKCEIQLEEYDESERDDYVSQDFIDEIYSLLKY